MWAVVCHDNSLLCLMDSRTETQLSGLAALCLTAAVCLTAALCLTTAVNFTAGLAAVCLTAEPSQQPIFYTIRKKENHLWTAGSQGSHTFL